MLKLIAYFLLIIAANFVFSPIHAVIEPFNTNRAYVTLANKPKQVALLSEMAKGRKPLMHKPIKLKCNSDFIGNGGIGKISLWLLAITFILAFWGNFIFPISPLIIILNLVCSFVLALIGFIIGGKNREKAKITLLLFSAMAIIAIIGRAIAWLILHKRGE